MITHNEVTAGLWLLTALSGIAGGWQIGRWRPSRQVLDDEHDDGYDAGWDDAMRRVDSDRWLAEQAAEEMSRPGDSGGRTVAGSALATIAEPITGPGRTTYAELSPEALGGPESHAEPANPRPVLDPHWYAKRLHELADWQIDWHQDAAAFDAWLPGYLEWYRRSLEPSWSRGGQLLAWAMEQIS